MSFRGHHRNQPPSSDDDVKPLTVGGEDPKSTGGKVIEVIVEGNRERKRERAGVELELRAGIQR